MYFTGLYVLNPTFLVFPLFGTMQIFTKCLTNVLILLVCNACHAQITQRNECSSPPGSDGIWLYHPPTGRCYEFATQGPCPDTMLYYKHPFQANHGFCDCDQGIRSEGCKDFPVRWKFYFPNSKRCYAIFSQGPCRNGYWLNYRRGWAQAKCEPNPCIREQTIHNPKYNWHGNGNSKFWFYEPRERACFQSETRGYCKDTLSLELVHDSHLPKCAFNKCFPTFTKFRSDLTCKAGSRFSYLWRGCVKSRSGHILGLG